MNRPPKVTLNDITGVNRTGATLSATISNSEGRQIKESGFIYSTASDFVNMTMSDIRKSSSCKVSQTSSPASSGTMLKEVNGLNPNTTYYYCAYVSSGYSVARSEVKSFKTGVEPLAQLQSCTITNVTTTSITITSGVIGNSNVTKYGFYYVAGTATPTENDGEVAISLGKPFSATITGLKPNTEYTFRAYAETESGVSYSQTVTQRTQKSVPSAEDNPFPGTN